MSKYDVIVIGAGHNGLTAAALLAKAGRKVLLLERRDSIGGLAGAVCFHEGYSAPGILHDTSGVRDWVVEKLALGKHGLERAGKEESAVFCPEEEGGGLLLHRDPEDAADELRRVSPGDVEGYARYRETIVRFRRVLEPLLNESPPTINPSSTGDFAHLLRLGLKARLLGGEGMTGFLRIVPMPVSDWMDECFVSPAVKALVAGPAHDGSYLGPRSPGSAAALLFHEAVAGAQVKGGGAALVGALEKACRAAGVKIRLSSPVEEIRFSAGAVNGVTVAGDERIEADAVA